MHNNITSQIIVPKDKMGRVATGVCDSEQQLEENYNGFKSCHFGRVSVPSISLKVLHSYSN